MDQWIDGWMDLNINPNLLFNRQILCNKCRKRHKLEWPTYHIDLLFHSNIGCHFIHRKWI